MKKKNNKSKILCIIIVITFILLFLLQSNVPMLGHDDFLLNSSYGRGLLFLFNQITQNILTWNGRSSQIIGFLVGFLPRWFFWLINSFAIILFLYLIYYYCFSESKMENKKIKYRSIILTFILCFSYIFYLFPATFDVFFWMPGACNHLWSVIITLIFLIPYYKSFYGKDFFNSKSNLIIILYVLFGFIAGSSLENISCFGILVILYSIFKSRKKINKWQIGGFLSYIIGIAYLYFLPSTKNRRFYFLTTSYIVQTGIKKIQYILEYFFKTNNLFIYIIILMLIAYIVYLKIKKENDNIFKNILLLVLFSIPTLLIMYFSPYYSDRALLLILFMGLILVIYIVQKLIIYNKYIYFIVCFCLCILNTIAYGYFYRVYSLSNKAFTARNNEILKNYSEGKQVIKYRLISCSYGERVIGYKETMTDDENSKNSYDNAGFRLYYNIDNFVGFRYIKDNKYNKYCIKKQNMFNLMGDNMFPVIDKYGGSIYYNPKKNNKK